MNKIIKFLKWGLPIFLFAMFFSIPNSKALTTDSFHAEFVSEKIYYSKTKDGVTRSERARYIYRNSDGQVVFCIQPGINLLENHPMQGYSKDEYSVTGMTKEQWDRINLIAYYGYNYGNHTGDKWFAVTQYMIWKTYPIGWDVYWVDSFHGNRITQFEQEEAEINNLINNHYVKPSFNNETINGKLEETIVLTDNNNVLSNYTISVNGKASYKIEGNKLYITPHEIGNITINFQKNSNRFNRQPIAYVDESSQNILLAGDLEPVNASVKINTTGGNVKIDKTGEKLVIKNGTYRYENIKLENVKYNIYANEDIITSDGVKHFSKDELIGTITTDSDGIAYLDNLYYGKYYAVEIETSGNNKLDSTEKYFEITSDNPSITIELENHYITGKLDFIKYDIATNIPLPNTKVEIHMIDENNPDEDILIGTYVTDENGKIIIEDLPVIDGKKYYVIEKEAPNGYLKDVEKIFFSISDQEIVRVSMTNQTIEVPDTEKNKSYSLEIFSVVAMIIGIGIMIYANKNKNK